MTDSKKMLMTKNIFFIKALRVYEFKSHDCISLVARILNPEAMQTQEIFLAFQVRKILKIKRLRKTKLELIAA